MTSLGCGFLPSVFACVLQIDHEYLFLVLGWHNIRRMTSFFEVLRNRSCRQSFVPDLLQQLFYQPRFPNQDRVVLVRRLRISMTRVISSSRPMTGSMLPWRAISVILIPNSSSKPLACWGCCGGCWKPPPLRPAWVGGVWSGWRPAGVLPG